MNYEELYVSLQEKEKTLKEKLSAMTANIAFAGFTAPKILWMRGEEPDEEFGEEPDQEFDEESGDEFQ